MSAVYAVNISDVSDCFPVLGLGGMLLRDFVDCQTTVEAEPGRIDGAALVLDGPAANNPERLDALFYVLQTLFGPSKIGRPVRCYQQGPRGGWKRLKPAPRKS